MKVVVAVIVDDQQRMLITRRPLHASHGGMWEFPGGKVEQDETPIAALTRELKEEVGLDVHGCEFLGEINHIYPQHPVLLLVYCVRHFSGVAVAREMQMDLRWVGMDSLGDFEFPEANQQILEMIMAYTSHHN